MQRPRRPRCRPPALPVLLLAMFQLGVAVSASAAEGEAEDAPGTLQRGSAAVEVGDDEETTYIGGPAYPGAPDDYLRVQFGSFWFPDASIGDGRVDLYRPDVLLRGNLPVLDLFVLRLNGNLGSSHYDFSDGTPFALLDGSGLELYRTSLSVDAAVRLNPEGRWFLFENEVWSLAARFGTGSEFEDGAFDEGLTSRVGVGIGYRDGDRLRVTVGAAFSTSIDDGDFGVSPIVSLRWRPVPKLTISDRGLGLRVAYQLIPSLELFANGYRSSDEYALDSRRAEEVPLDDGVVLGADQVDDLTFRDRQWQVGAGFEWKYNRAFRVNFEAGAIVDRELRVESDDEGELFAQDADPSAYVGLRFEVRL